MTLDQSYGCQVARAELRKSTEPLDGTSLAGERDGPDVIEHTRQLLPGDAHTVSHEVGVSRDRHELPGRDRHEHWPDRACSPGVCVYRPVRAGYVGGISILRSVRPP